MITIKSNREIELMKEAGRICALAHRKIKEAITLGISTYKLDKIAERVIIECGATPSFKGYNGYPASICASVNNVVIHGIPDKKTKLKNGDIIAIDIGACYKGYHGDCAYTYGVGNISPKRQELLKVTEEALYVGLEHAKPNNYLSDISHAIERYVTERGYSVVKDFTGHGIGCKLHESPPIPNFGLPGYGPILKPGMTLAIEPMVNIGSSDVLILVDNWTTVTEDGFDSAHFEHTIVITEGGHTILTKEGQ
ncbi:MAG: type I methionyl aminopeptidase [Bacilli bacterium]|nr:type I methionyl aminopeptidase [Bacilli bacterium]MDD4076434.1 type I methionyl aminopeptidase [Bacilli bacterium]